MKNVPLLRKVRDHIAERPWEWEQNQWVIEIDAAVDLRAALFKIEAKHLLLDRYGHDLETLQKKVAARDFTCDTAFCVAGWAAYFAAGDDLKVDLEVGEVWVGDVPVEVYAMEQLGLSTIEANMLFQARNSFRSVMSYLDRFIADGEREMAR